MVSVLRTGHRTCLLKSHESTGPKRGRGVPQVQPPTRGAGQAPRVKLRHYQPMTPLTDLEEFVADHRPHGPLTGDATAPAWNGYRLTVACPWVVFARWVTPQEADADLLRLAVLN